VFHTLAIQSQVWESTLQARFHYVSGTPCQLWQPLSAFLANKGFPKGSFHLLSFRVRGTCTFPLSVG
jgi:phosphatidate phosphatase APP1